MEVKNHKKKKLIFKIDDLHVIIKVMHLIIKNKRERREEEKPSLVYHINEKNIQKKSF